MKAQPGSSTALIPTTVKFTSSGLHRMWTTGLRIRFKFTSPCAAKHSFLMDVATLVDEAAAQVPFEVSKGRGKTTQGRTVGVVRDGP